MMGGFSSLSTTDFQPETLALDLLQSRQVGEGQGEDGLIQAGTLSHGVLLGDSVEGSEVEPICVRLHVCVR